MSNTVSMVPDQVETPAMMPTTQAAGPESLIDKHSRFSGSYRSTHNLQIQGEVEGEIDCRSTLTIDSEAQVRAKVMAQNVIVGGSLEGEVNCIGRFQILPTGRVSGRVVAGRLEIHAGAFCEGDFSMQHQSDLPCKNSGNGNGRAAAAPDSRPLAIVTPVRDKAASAKSSNGGASS